MKNVIEHMTALKEQVALVHAYVVRAFAEICIPEFMCEDKAWDIYTYAEGKGYCG
jgi:hypothetical protein